MAGVQAALNDFLGGSEPVTLAAPALGDLTARETQVLDHMARGLSNAHDCGRHGYCGEDPRNHVTDVFAKLGTPQRAQAIVLARKAGLGRD